MAGYLPYSQARAALAAQRPRQRPWSPPIVDPRSTASGRDIEAFLAHASHGWAAEREDGPHNPQADEDDLFSRHRTHFRGRREPSSDHNYGYEYTYNRARNQRKEASDVSVEALDLADYAMTLRRQGPEWDPYPSYDYPTPTAQRPFSRENPPTSATAPTLSSGRRRRGAELSPPRNAPPSAYPHDRLFSPTYLPAPAAAPPLDRPFSALSRDTTRPPPSLISAGATSHSSHAESSYPPAPYSSQSVSTHNRVILPLIIEKISSQTRIVTKTSVTTSRLPASSLAHDLHTSPHPIKPTPNDPSRTPSRSTIGRSEHQLISTLGAGLV